MLILFIHRKCMEEHTLKFLNDIWCWKVVQIWILDTSGLYKCSGAFLVTLLKRLQQYIFIRNGLQISWQFSAEQWQQIAIYLRQITGATNILKNEFGNNRPQIKLLLTEKIKRLNGSDQSKIPAWHSLTLFLRDGWVKR